MIERFKVSEGVIARAAAKAGDLRGKRRLDASIERAKGLPFADAHDRVDIVRILVEQQAGELSALFKEFALTLLQAARFVGDCSAHAGAETFVDCEGAAAKQISHGGGVFDRALRL